MPNEKQELRPIPKLRTLLVAYLNMEAVVIPGLQMAGLSGVLLWLASCIWATAELWYWHWLVGLILARFFQKQVVRDAFLEGRALGTDAKEALEDLGIADRCVLFILKYLNPERVKHPDLRNIAYGIFYVAMLCLGVAPTIWIAGVFICRLISQLKNGFYAIVVGNLIKTTLAVVVLEHTRRFNWTIIVAFTVLFPAIWVYKRIKRRNQKTNS